MLATVQVPVKVCIIEQPETSLCVVLIFYVCCDFCIFDRLARDVEMTNLDACERVDACNSMCNSQILVYRADV